jgi:hypothetical protein
LGFPAKLIDLHPIDLRTGAESETDLGEIGVERRGEGKGRIVEGFGKGRRREKNTKIGTLVINISSYYEMANK